MKKDLLLISDLCGDLGLVLNSAGNSRYYAQILLNHSLVSLLLLLFLIPRQLSLDLPLEMCRQFLHFLRKKLVC